MCGVLCAASQCSLLLFLLGLLRLWFFLGFYAIHNISFVFFFFVHLFFVSIFILLPFPSLALFCSLLIYVRISFRVRWFFYVYHGIWVCLCVYGSLLHRLDLLFAIYTELHMSSITACVSHCIVWSNLLHIIFSQALCVIRSHAKLPSFFYIYFSFGFSMHSQVSLYFISFAFAFAFGCMEICSISIFFSRFINVNETFNMHRYFSLRAIQVAHFL